MMQDESQKRRSRASRRRTQEGRSSHRPMRLVQLVLALAEQDDVGLTQQDLLAHPRLMALYNANASAAYQAFADDVKELGKQSLIGLRTQSVPLEEALIRYDVVTGHFHLAIHYMCCISMVQHWQRSMHYSWLVPHSLGGKNYVIVL